MSTSKLSIASWNINSVRLRKEQVVAFLENNQPDILALQETKTPDEHFPYETFKQIGYEHCFFNGMKSYNGVCFISKHPLEHSKVHNRVEREDCRHIETKIQIKGFDQTLTIHNLYIPAGGDEPDVSINPKFDHKLKFISEMTKWFKNNHTSKEPVVVLGDFNIAPYEHDVWSHKQLLKVVSHTPIEVEHLEEMRQSIDWIDVAREFVEHQEKLYSWWSYRSKDWTKNDRGRRLDHIWVTPALKDHMSDFKILRDLRSMEKPSDHVPIILDLNF